MDRGSWWATIHRVTKSWTSLSTHVLFKASQSNQNKYKMSMCSQNVITFRKSYQSQVTSFEILGKIRFSSGEFWRQISPYYKLMSILCSEVMIKLTWHFPHKHRTVSGGLNNKAPWFGPHSLPGVCFDCQM